MTVISEVLTEIRQARYIPRFLALPNIPGFTLDKWKGGQEEQGPRTLPIFAICHTELFVLLFLPAGEKEKWATVLELMEHHGFLAARTKP